MRITIRLDKKSVLASQYNGLYWTLPKKNRHPENRGRRWGKVAYGPDYLLLPFLTVILIELDASMP